LLRFSPIVQQPLTDRINKYIMLYIYDVQALEVQANNGHISTKFDCI